MEILEKYLKVLFAGFAILALAILTCGVEAFMLYIACMTAFVIAVILFTVFSLGKTKTHD